MIIIICVIVLLIIFKMRTYSSEEIGEIGEQCVIRELSWLPKEYITLNDILLPTQYGTTQIDHIVVSPYGIFVIETKNYKGCIWGHQDSKEWKQGLLGKKNYVGWSNEQYKFQNPIHQNLLHFRAVRSVLKNIGDFTIIPIVAFSDSAELNITAPNHIVINWRDLHSVIQSYNHQCISPENVQRIIERLSTVNIITEGSREQHTLRIQTKQQIRELAIANRRCPKCGGNLVERVSKYGTFWGCSNFPRCRFTYND